MSISDNLYIVKAVSRDTYIDYNGITIYNPYYHVYNEDMGNAGFYERQIDSYMNQMVDD